MLGTIKLGSQGDVVKVAQYLIGYAKIGKANGVFDDKFAAEVGAWQGEHKVKVTYEIDEDTWIAIGKTLPTCSTSKNKKSAYTCAIQLLVGHITVDGIYGSKTKKAVAAFQSACGLDVDGVCGPKTWAALILGKSVAPSSDKVLNDCVKYLQWDRKWKNIKYSTHTSKQTIGNSGCGTTSMAMILATWADPKITPVETSKWAVDNGYRTYDSGTAWGFYKWIFKKFDCFEKYIETSSISALEAALREGALAVCSMNSNDNKFWTSQGHFIVARGVDATYFYANDPNKETTPRKQEKAKFKKCLKKAFVFYPKKKVNDKVTIDEPIELDEEVKGAEEIQTDLPINLNGAIIDISKWQGTIDFNKLKKEVSLVIARASCGSDKDARFDEYAAAMNKLGIPFGVYCYSYAADEAKAKDEAQKMIKYASKYNPLFYVMDAEEKKLTKNSISAFAKELKNQGVKKIGCYVAGNELYTKYQFESVRDLFDFIWIPRYGKNDGTIAGSKKPNYKCDLWQYSSTAKIKGISGNVDVNVITNEGHDLKWFLTR